MTHFWVYLLRCADGSYYAGHSDNLEGRLWQHQQGIGCDWTRRRRPVELVWTEALPTRDEAFAFERRIKGWTRAKKEALIASDWDRISWLARPPHERPTCENAANISARPERSRASGEVEGRKARPSRQRPSTSLRTSEGEAQGTARSSKPHIVARPERSRASGEVEGRMARPSRERPSTSLRTSDGGDRQ